MHYSSLSTGFDDMDDDMIGPVMHGECGLPDIAALHHALIAMLYGYDVSIKAFFLRDDVYGKECESLNEHLPWICAAIALAEYYGSLPFVASKFIDLMSSRRHFWEEIGVRPVPWLRIAIKLESKELYFNCMRLILSRSDFDVHIREFDMTLQEAQENHAALQAHLDPIVRKLEKDLLRLRLTEQHFRYDGDDVRALTTFFHALRFRSSSRSQVTKANERAD